MKLPNQSVNAIRGVSIQPVIQGIHPAQAARLIPFLSRQLGFTSGACHFFYKQLCLASG